MLVVSILSCVFSLLVLISFILIICIVIKEMKEDSSKNQQIEGLRADLNKELIKNSILSEAFADYKKSFPVKTKYRVNMEVYYVVNNKPYCGVIEQIHQDNNGKISYTIKKNKKLDNMFSGCPIKVEDTVTKKQEDVYKTLTDAIDGEQLIS